MYTYGDAELSALNRKFPIPSAVLPINTDFARRRAGRRRL